MTELLSINSHRELEDRGNSDFPSSRREDTHRWVKGGEGSAAPFTRTITYVLDIYTVLVKGEGCF